MSFRRVTLAVIMTLALLLPAVALAQTSSAFGNAYTLWASLQGDNEIPPGDPDGLGFARITIDLDTNTVCFQLSVANIDTPTASHIHRGGAGVNGPVVVPLAAPVEGFARGCADIDPVLATEILNNPAGFYVNVHTGAYPPGAVRGQLAPLGGVPISVPVAEPPTVETVVSGLNSPRGIDVGSDGTVYFAQAGDGGDDCVTLSIEGEDREVCFGDSSSVSMVVDGEAVDIMTDIPSFLFAEGEYIGAQDVLVEEDGTVIAIVGLGMDPALRDAAGEPAEGLGTVIIATGDGDWEVIEDVAAYEAANNPDGGLHDSNPYSGFVTEAGGVVSDAGANALISYPFDGEPATLAVFPNTMVDAPPFLELPPGTQIPMQAVPTGTALGPDGAIYVGQLTGFPFVEGAAKVYRIVPGEEPTVFAEGFTNIVDLSFDADGNLWVLEIAAGSLLNVDPENPASMAGGLYRVTPDGDVSAQMSEGLVFPTGIDFGPDGTLYISNYGLMPGMGEIISVTWND